MPLQRRVPKRGFKNPSRRSYEVVNVGELGRVGTDEVDKKALKDAGLIRSMNMPVKLLGSSKLERKFNVTVEAFSASAREAIESAGGKCNVIESSRVDFKTRQEQGAD
jgi:large subunit ribosomal protein L15